MRVEVGLAPECAERYSGQVLGLRAQTVVDVTHYLSAGAVCFARAVNDTPKIAALLFAAAALGASLATPMLAAVALADRFESLRLRHPVVTGKVICRRVPVQDSRDPGRHRYELTAAAGMAMPALEDSWPTCARTRVPPLGLNG